jgi:hypothetical protein
MGWDKKDLNDSTRFGKLYVITDVMPNGVCVAKRLRRRKETFFAEKKDFYLRIYDLPSEISPSKKDLVYQCDSDKSVSLLKPGHHFPAIKIRV